MDDRRVRFVVTNRSWLRPGRWTDAAGGRLTSTVETAARGAVSGWRLDAVFTLLALWMAAGIAWDFRTHARGISFADEGFFTAPHVTFYAAFLAIGLLVGGATVANYRRGLPLRRAVPRGYRLALLGVGLFLVGGPADFAWHSRFGFEVGVEALTSPSHLLLLVGALLFLSAPLRAAWFREGTPAGVRQVPMLLSAAFVALGLSLFTVYQNPLVQPLGVAGGPSPDHSFLGILWFSAIVASLGLTLARRFGLAFGAFALVLSLLGLLVTAVTSAFEFVPAMALAGVLADGIVSVGRDRWHPVATLRLLGAALPASLFALYFATVALRYGLDWPVHVWTGGVVFAGLVGVLLSYVVAPAGVSPGRAERDRSGEDMIVNYQ